MKNLRIGSVVIVLAAVNAAAQELPETQSSAIESPTTGSHSAQSPPVEPRPRQSQQTQSACLTCHADEALMVGELKRLHITANDLANDVHWQKGIQCHDCHGGDAKEVDFRKAHFKDSGFRSIKSPADIPDFCGHCHSDPSYMRNYSPSPRTDQVATYWTSGHGQKLKETGDKDVATCVSCHGSHDVRAVDDLASRVYPTRVAGTCASCHSDPERMAGREYNGRPLGHDQFELWSKSVHAQVMKAGDMSAPTCNDCHGNHGALPPEVGSVANACGVCHVKIGELFANTTMKHRFEAVSLPGCASCHNHHDILVPSDELLGMSTDAVCASCHNRGDFGATFLGGQVAQEMRSGLDQLKEEIKVATEKLDRAERLGMEVREPRFRLRGANDALKNARTIVHSFATEPLQEALDVGLKISEEAQQAADGAVREYTFRRVWLGLSLVPIFIVIGLLLLYIRTLSVPTIG